MDAEAAGEVGRGGGGIVTEQPIEIFDKLRAWRLAEALARAVGGAA